MLIADLLGFEPELHDDLLRWSDDLIRATTLERRPRWPRPGGDAMRRLPRVPARVIAERRARRGTT